MGPSIYHVDSWGEGGGGGGGGGGVWQNSTLLHEGNRADQARIHVDTRSPKYLLTNFLFEIFILAIFFRRT